MLGPGDSEIGLNLALVVLVDEAWIFTFPSGSLGDGHVPSCIQHRCGPLAMLLWPDQQSQNVVAPHSEEPLQDPLTPHIVSISSVHSNFALHLTEGVLAYTYWSRIKIRAHSEGLGIPLDKVAEPTH